jgi:hypothetical protein
MNRVVSPLLIKHIYDRLFPHLTPKEVDDLEALGITTDTLVRDPIVKAGYVNFDEDPFIEQNVRLQTENKRVVSMLARDNVGNACDIVAWDQRSGRIGTYLGEAWALGAEVALRPRLFDQPLPIWSTPLSYLRGGRTGILPLRLSALPYELDSVRKVVFDDPVFGQKVESEFRRFVPEFWVRGVEIEA